MDLSGGVKRWAEVLLVCSAILARPLESSAMRIRSRLVMSVFIAPLLSGCAFGQSSTRAPQEKSSAAISAEAALADFSPDERDRILAVQPVVEAAAAERKIDPSLINAIIWVESRFDPHAQSPAGARGLMQLMPATAAYLAKRLDEPRPRANDPEFNVRAGALYLAEMLEQFDDETHAVAAYHAGPGNVRKWLDGRREFPDWSNEYVAKVVAARERFRDLPHGAKAEDRVAVGEVEVVEDEPIEAPDPDTLPDASEVRRMAAAGVLDEPAPEPEPTPEPEPEPEPVVIEEEVFELVFEVHPEADANPNAGPPPGWPRRAQSKPSQPEPSEPPTKRTIASKPPTPPAEDEQETGLGVLPDL
jgi:hypothetical protein